MHEPKVDENQIPVDGERPQDELRASPIVMVGIVSSILIFVIIVGLSAWFLILEKEEGEKKASPFLPDDLRRLRNQQMGEINAYRWVSEKDGVVRIPIERAMEIVVEEEARKSGR